jgi:hypothetical protein
MVDRWQEMPDEERFEALRQALKHLGGHYRRDHRKPSGPREGSGDGSSQAERALTCPTSTTRSSR